MGALGQGCFRVPSHRERSLWADKSRERETKTMSKTTTTGWLRRLACTTVLAFGVSGVASAPVFAQTKPVVIASPEDMTSLDPHMLDSNHPTGSAIWSMFDSLVRRAPDGSSVPRLAESWREDEAAFAEARKEFLLY